MVHAIDTPRPRHLGPPGAGMRLGALWLLMLLLAAACTGGGDGTSDEASPSPADVSASGPGVTVSVQQDPDKTVYWVLPGKRRLSPQVFGTPFRPQRTGEAEIAAAAGATRELLEKLPLLVGIPLPARETTEDGAAFTTTAEPVPVGDDGKIVSGSFQVTYIDRQPYDLPGSAENDDDVEASARFTDPAGNRYEIVVKRLFQPDLPGWQTGGGVVTGAWIHGTTGTDSPLFPTTFAHGAFWGVGDLRVNGETVDRDKWVHFMTTQTVRDPDYRLATNEELPLGPDDTIAGVVHHTHVIMRPIKIAPDGIMTFDPVKTAFELPNGRSQPYLHLMFEQDTITEGPFGDWTFAQATTTTPTTDAADTGPAATGRELTVTAEEFSFAPQTIAVQEGEAVTIVLRNQGELAHNIGIDELDVQSRTIRPGEEARITFTPARSGAFTYSCHVPGHREAGMSGTLDVQGPG